MIMIISYLFLLVLTEFSGQGYEQLFLYIGGNLIENVSSYVHLGHVITAQLDDFDDILKRRNTLTILAKLIMLHVTLTNWRGE